MNFVLIADTYLPSKTSGAVQLCDLANEFSRRGHSITILVPDPNQLSKLDVKSFDGVTVVRLKTFDIKSHKYFHRAIAEFLMPFCMMMNLLRSPVAISKWDGIIWYSPSIFFGPLVHYLKIRNKCKAYLILRDIFPEWTLDLGLINPGLLYWMLKLIARYQYYLADTIGIQAKSNEIFFKNRSKLEILENWTDLLKISQCSIDLSKTRLSGKKIFLYAGNMGVAQDLKIFILLAQEFSARGDIGFVFVGRGSEKRILETYAQTLGLNNILFYDEISPSELLDLYRQVKFGIVSLNIKHKTHNIPGKFVSYMAAGLPVLARINPLNDLKSIIEESNVGFVSSDDSLTSLKKNADSLIIASSVDKAYINNCKNLYFARYTSIKAVDKIHAKFKHT